MFFYPVIPQDLRVEASPTFVAVHAGTLTITSGSITDTSGLIDFGDENLKTTGYVGFGISPSEFYQVRSLMQHTGTSVRYAGFFQANYGNDSVTGSMYGLYGRCVIDDEVTRDIGSMVAFAGEVYVTPVDTVMDITTEVIGVKASIVLGSDFAGDIASTYGIKISYSDDISGTITDAYGLYISDFPGSNQFGIKLVGENSGAGAIWFGTTINARIYCDGTHLIIDPDYPVGSNGVVLDGSVIIGSGDAGEDYTLTYNGETEQGRIIWYEDEGYFAAQMYDSGAWVLAEFEIAYDSLLLGDNLSIGAAGDQLVTKSRDGTNQHLYARTSYGSSTGTEELRVMNLGDKVSHFISQSDDTGEFSGTFFTYVISGFVADVLSVEIYLKVGSVDATEPVTIAIYEGPDNTYTKKFSKVYPAYKFSSRTGVIDATNDGGVTKFTVGSSTDLWVGMEVVNSGFTTNTSYNGTYEITSTDGSTYYEISSISYGSDESGTYTTYETLLTVSDHVDLDNATSNTFEFSSDATFSLKLDTTNTYPWIAGTFYPAYYEHALITKEWTESDSTTIEDWFISHDDKKIFVANAAQAKAATFAADAQYWNELSPFVFSWEQLPSTQDLFVPTYHQMAVHGMFTLEGQLNLDGTLAIRS